IRFLVRESPMSHATMTCPACVAVLKVPDTVPAGAALKCPRCAARFRRGAAAPAADPKVAEFWETVQLDDLPELDRPAPPPEPAGWAFEHWTQDPAEARKLAAEQGKDVLLLFTGSDWCPACIALAKGCLTKPEFDAWLHERFVPVYLDFPRTPAGQAQV